LDIADLVRTQVVSLLRAPALHMLVIGGLLFAAMAQWGGALDASVRRPQILIPRQRIEIARAEYMQEIARLPTPEEEQAIVDALVDEEVLYRYALDLGMDQEPVVQRRLARIAAFVEANPHESRSEKELAHQAMELGLNDGDLVVRRILSDGARRLIRAVVLVRQPDEASLQEYFRANGEQFLRPAETRLTHVAVDGWKHPADTRERAQSLLEEIRDRRLEPAAAIGLGDEPFVPSGLPLQTDIQLIRHFGVTFTDAVRKVPVGEWGGPVPSRYGEHLVYVHERRPPYMPPFDEIRAKVQERYLHKLADEWLALRLRELRAGYDIVVSGGTS
jgi:hypothetical protein